MRKELPGYITESNEYLRDTTVHLLMTHYRLTPELGLEEALWATVKALVDQRNRWVKAEIDRQWKTGQGFFLAGYECQPQQPPTPGL